MSALATMTSQENFFQKQPEKRIGEPDWLFELRTRAFERAVSLGVPNRKNEAWKYLLLDPIIKSPWTVASAPATVASMPSFGISNSIGRIPEEENCLYFKDGHYQENTSKLSKNFQSLVVTQLGDSSLWIKEYLERGISQSNNPFFLLNTSNFRQGIFVRIPPKTILEKPLHIVFAQESPNVFISPRICVAAEEGASVELVFHFRGQNLKPYFLNSAIDCMVKSNAKVSMTFCQQEGLGAIHFLNLQATLSENSMLNICDYVSGGSVIRNDSHVELTGAGARFDFAGLSVLAENSNFFQHVNVYHKAPSVISRQVQKNVLAGKSISEFNSCVHVLRGAAQSDSEQLNKNLLLSDDARIYARPQLKIDHDDVKASHGAATGKLQESELFYLRSRGLNLKKAQFLLIYGFAHQVIERISTEWLRKELESDIEKHVHEIMEKDSLWL